MDGDARDSDQPKWLTNSRSGVSPYHRNFGAASDWFFEGWACFGFTADPTTDPDADCMHIPYGLWFVDTKGVRGEKGLVYCDSEDVPDEYKVYLVAVPLGFGEGGILVDGKDTIDQALKIEEAYLNRLDNPIPLTVLTLRDDIYFGMDKDKRAELRDEWNEGRRKNSTALKPEAMKVDLPGATVGTDLYETGRNAVRLDIANHVSSRHPSSKASARAAPAAERRCATPASRTATPAPNSGTSASPSACSSPSNRACPSTTSSRPASPSGAT